MIKLHAFKKETSKKKKKKNNNIGYYKPRKRKAISPIKSSEYKSGVTVGEGGQGNLSGQLREQSYYNSVSPDNSDKEQVKRFHQSSPDYFNFKPYTRTEQNRILLRLKHKTAYRL